MTTRDLTPILSIPHAMNASAQPVKERLFQSAFAAVQWPWLLRGLYGGTKHSKVALVQRLTLAPESLPHLGSWKADTYLLHRLVDLIEEHKPRIVVELGSGASTLVIAKALKLHVPDAHLISFDQHADFVSAVNRWLRQNDLAADLRHAPLSRRSSGWPGLWYNLRDVPSQIDLLVVDGPPWAVHPYVRGAAETLFSRLAQGGIIVLDDAARPGERLIARRWRREWPGIRFDFESGGSKGTLIGRRIDQQDSWSVAFLRCEA